MTGALADPPPAAKATASPAGEDAGARPCGGERRTAAPICDPTGRTMPPPDDGEDGEAAATFVCAFRGRRDDYQVPLALAQGRLLDRFVTDLYAIVPLERAAMLLPPAVRRKLKSRRKPGIPEERIVQFPHVAIREMALRYSPSRADEIRDRHDHGLSLEAAAQARANRSHLLLYAPYAAPAFAAPYKHDPVKIVFQYHPHHAAEAALLEADDRRFGRRCDGIETAQTAVRPHRIASDETFRAADRIVCASAFTARTFVAAGADPDRITVAGYGVAPPTGELRPRDGGGFEVLFVGSALQRKGIHHLLRAWRSARLPRGARLVVIARTQDAFVRRELARTGTDGVVVLQGVPAQELRRRYATASLFCMPSLVEGFGQVYLEALAAGLPVLGTANTGLPDLGGEADGIFLTDVGEIDALAANLERLAEITARNEALRHAARRTAGRHSWDAFRAAIRHVCRDAVAARPA